MHINVIIRRKFGENLVIIIRLAFQILSAYSMFKSIPEIAPFTLFRTIFDIPSKKIKKYYLIFLSSHYSERKLYEVK